LDLNHHLARGALWNLPRIFSNPDAMAGKDWKEVPEDILTMIFEAVRGDGYAIALASVITVCRRWHVSMVQDYCSSVLSRPHKLIQRIAIPAYYRRLGFKTAEALERAATKISTVHMSGTLAEGKHVRVLHFLAQDTASIPSHRHLDILNTLLMAFDRIEDLELPHAAIPSHLALAALRFETAMRSLGIHISATLSPTFLCVQRFTSLRKLAVWTDEGVFSANAAPIGWTLPLVQELAWSSSQRDPDAEMRFLSTCNFGSLRVMLLSIPALKEQSTEAMQTFFRKHPHITMLSAHCSAQWRASAMFAVAKPDHFKCLDEVPRVSALKHLPPSVRVLALVWDRKTAQPWAVLKALGGSAFGPHVEDVRLESNDRMEPFSWKEGWRSPDHATFVGMLLGYAAVLRARRDILIVDDKGLTADVFSRHYGT
jgi:hypothetical protein